MRQQLRLNWAARERTSLRLIAHFQVGISPEGVATLGYILARDHHGRGYATEGMLEVLALLRTIPGVIEAKAFSDSRNAASHRVALRLGMKQVDFIKDADFFKGGTSDELVFSIRLRESQ